MLAGFKKPIVITGARPARTRGPCGAPFAPPPRRVRAVRDGEERQR